MINALKNRINRLEAYHRGKNTPPDGLLIISRDSVSYLQGEQAEYFPDEPAFTLWFNRQPKPRPELLYIRIINQPQT